MRGKQSKKRKIKEEGVYKSLVASKFINKLMKSGKKMLAEKIFYKSMDILKKDLKGNPLVILEKSLENIRPKLEVRARRVGGVNYQIPLPIPENRQIAVAIKWIIKGAKERRKDKEFYVALAEELKDAYKKMGFAYRKKEETHKMAEANKAFAHFQW